MATARPEEAAAVAEEQAAVITRLRAAFIREMDDDINTANGITVLYELAKEANLYMRNANVGAEQLRAYTGLFEEIAWVLGLVLGEEEELLDDQIEALIAERTEARKQRNFKRADEIRDLLAKQGIILEDTPQGIRWRRK
jgi:cysteinyl-tRNA synthetase